MSLLTIGIFIARVDVDTPTANLYGYEVLVGFGTGCFIQVSSFGITYSRKRARYEGSVKPWKIH